MNKSGVVSTSWWTLLRIVAFAVIIVNFIPMLFILKQFIPQLAIANGLVAIILLLTWICPRTGAIGVGVLSVILMVLNFAKIHQVIPDLTIRLQHYFS